MRRYRFIKRRTAKPKEEKRESGKAAQAGRHANVRCLLLRRNNLRSATERERAGSRTLPVLAGSIKDHAGASRGTPSASTSGSLSTGPEARRTNAALTKNYPPITWRHLPPFTRAVHTCERIPGCWRGDFNKCWELPRGISNVREKIPSTQPPTPRSTPSWWGLTDALTGQADSTLPTQYSMYSE